MKIHNPVDHSLEWIEEHYKDIDVHVLVDLGITENDHYENAFGVLYEPPGILNTYAGGVDVFNHIGKKMQSGQHRFKTLYTNFHALRGLPNTVILDACPWASFIHKDDWKVHEKTKCLSFVNSTKKMTGLQILRCAIADHIADHEHADVFGRGTGNEIIAKIDGLKDYRFSIAMENTVAGGYHTEKIIDCFLTGTVPVYVGDPDIGDVYNLDGIIRLQNEHIFENEAMSFKYTEMGEILMDPVKSEELYVKMLPAIHENYFIACERTITSLDHMLIPRILEMEGLK